MENKLGQNEPAFPANKEMQELDPNCFGYSSGISKRLYIAVAVMQGLLANQDRSGSNNKSIVQDAYDIADEFLKQENNG